MKWLTSTTILCLVAFVADSQQSPTPGQDDQQRTAIRERLPSPDTDQRSRVGMDRLRASVAFGAQVKFEGGPDIGKVSDVILSRDRVAFLVVRLPDNKLVPIPFTLITASAVGQPAGTADSRRAEVTFTARTDQLTLENAPTISPPQWSDIQRPEWSKRVYAHFGVRPDSAQGGPGSETRTESGKEKSRIEQKP